jgi:uncharacterized membrane protein YkvA (DUF1232 family)
MRISLELEPADIERFHAALARARRAAACADEYEVIEAAKYALDHLNTADVPTFVRKRVVEVQKLIVMLEDEAWALSGPERCDIIETLVYFSDPDDLIPDEVEVIGLLDDAILLELLLQRMRHVRKAYAEFCAFRAALATDLRDAAERRSHARDLAALRTQLQARMRRGRQRAQAGA